MDEQITGCSAVNDHISKPIPATLWHYTSYNGFHGIITSKRVWATEYRFLNDREEFLHARELALAVVEEEPEIIGEFFPAREYVRKAVNIVFNTGYMTEERLRVMVASFSEAGDQLSQWRGYANDSRGVCIGFDLRDMRPTPGLGSTVTFAPCIYDQETKRALLKAIFTDYRNRVYEWWGSTMNLAHREGRAVTAYDPQSAATIVKGREPELQRALKMGHVGLQFDLIRAAPLLKNESFSEEREWRLVLPCMPDRGRPNINELEFRCMRDGIVPYFASLLPRVANDGPITCTDVILGSGCHPAAEVGVNLFLQKAGIRVLAKRSAIPYRPT